MAAFFMAAFTNGKVADGTSLLSYGALPIIISILVGVLVRLQRAY